MENLPPSYPPPLPPDPSRLRVGAIVRDVAILLGLTFAGGFVIGFVSAAMHSGVRPSTAIIGLTNIVLIFVAFTIAGSLVPPAVRWKHLAVVALIGWLCGLFNVLFFHMSFVVWVFSAVAIVLPMAMGGAVSYLFNRDPGPRI